MMKEQGGDRPPVPPVLASQTEFDTEREVLMYGRDGQYIFNG